MTNNRRVVVTGIGAVSPVGIRPSRCLEGVAEWYKWGSKITHFNPDDNGLEVKIAAEVKDFNIADFFPDRRKVGSMMKEMDR